MRKEYLVSLDITTSNKITVPKLCEYLKMREGELSCRKLETWREKGVALKETKLVYWRFESRLNETYNIIDHIKDMTTLISFDKPFKPTKDIKNIEMVVGVLYPSGTFPSVYMSRQCLELISKYWPGINMQFIFYPDSD